MGQRGEAVQVRGILPERIVLSTTLDPLPAAQGPGRVQRPHTPLAAEAQPPRKVPRIGFLWTGSPPKDALDAFRQGLREADYIEGQNIAIEHITSTTWGHEAWPEVRPVLRRALEMRRQIAPEGWWN